MFTTGINMGLPLQARVKKTVRSIQPQLLFCNENIQSATVGKEGHVDNILVHEKIHLSGIP